MGKTSLVYHLSWMFAELGLKVIACDLDPQANLTSMFLTEDRLEQIWPEEEAHKETVLGCIQPILKGKGDIASARIEEVADNLGLVMGDLGLSTYEDRLSDAWPNCLDGDEAAFRVISAFYRIMLNAVKERQADLVLIDVGPNLGAINRAAIISADYVVVPLSPDLFSLQGLKNLGPTLRRWREQWKERLLKKPKDLPLPEGKMSPIGYVIMQYRIRSDRPTKSYERWANQIPMLYQKVVLGNTRPHVERHANDPERLSMIKHYQSLMPMAQAVHKPIFKLTMADGAIGSHVEAVENCGKDFKGLAEKIAVAVELSL